MSDPVRVLWARLEAGGYRPRGKPYQFRSRCPAHDGDNPTSLSVGAGADGRALVTCFAHGCSAEAITAALGLGIHDLFPDGHHRARRRPLLPLRRSDFTGAARDVVNVLYTLEKLGEPWQLSLPLTCAHCGERGAWLRADRDGVEFDCASGCDAHQITQALLGRLHDQKETSR